MRRETVKYITQFFAIFWTPEVIWQLFAIIFAINYSYLRHWRKILQRNATVLP